MTKTFDRVDSIGFVYRVPVASRVVDVLVGLDMAESGKRAKQLIRDGGVRVNDVAVTDLGATLAPDVIPWDGFRGTIIKVGNGVGLTSAGGAKRYLVTQEERT